MSGARTAAGLGLATAALAVLALAAFAVGQFPVAPGDALAVLGARLTGAAPGVPAVVDTVVVQVRLPRILAAMLVGAALAAAGAAYQTMFRNPLVSPDILGVSSGAGLGAVLGIVLALPVAAIQAMAFGFGLAAVLVVTLVARLVRGSHDETLVLVLAGVVVGALLGAGIALLTYLADPYDQLPAITFWMLGSLASVKLGDLPSSLPAILVGLVPLVALRWRVNLLALDEEEAQAMGVDTARLRLVLIVAATLMTAAAVSITGIVGWIGLIIPHFARLLVGPEFSRLLPAAVLIGAAYMLGVDTLARTAAAIELPLGVLNAFVGAPVFLWLLARSRRAWR